MTFVYWVYDRTCNCSDEGYIGVSEQPEKRLCQLRRALGRNKAHILILFEGSRKACLRRERWYRSRRNVGWNKARGGIASAPIKHGLTPRSDRPIFSRRELKQLWG